MPGGARVICLGCPRFFVFLSSCGFLSARSVLGNSVELLRSAPNNGNRELPHLLASEPNALHGDGKAQP